MIIPNTPFYHKPFEVKEGCPQKIKKFFFFAFAKRDLPDVSIGEEFLRCLSPPVPMPSEIDCGPMTN